MPPMTLAVKVSTRVGFAGSSVVMVSVEVLTPEVEVFSTTTWEFAGGPGAAVRSKGPRPLGMVKPEPEVKAME